MTRTRRLDTGISPNYAKDWTAVEAIREILQNYLDIRRELGVGGGITWDEDQMLATVRDQGPGLEMRHLALGISEKGEGSTGQFGEGLKLAMLVLAREGRHIEVRTRGEVIQAEIAQSEAYETETLHLVIKPMAPRHAATCTGTSIRFTCGEGELAEAKAYFTELSQIDWVERGKISLPGGWLYVNGSRVAELPTALFSYHLSGDRAREILNRDRNTVNHSLAKDLVARTLAQTSSTLVIRTLLEELIEGRETWETHQMIMGSLPTDRRRVWKRVWNQLYSEDAVFPGSSANDQQAEYRGHQVLHRTNRWWIGTLSDALGVPTSDMLMHRLAAETRKPKVVKLTGGQQDALDWAIETVEANYHELGDIEVMVVANIDDLAGTGDAVWTRGLWSPRERMIYLSPGLLADRRQLLHTLLHEAVHAVSGASDLTSEFERALLEVAVGLLMSS